MAAPSNTENPRMLRRETDRKCGPRGRWQEGLGRHECWAVHTLYGGLGSSEGLGGWGKETQAVGRHHPGGTLMRILQHTLTVGHRRLEKWWPGKGQGECVMHWTVGAWKVLILLRGE